MAEMSNVTPESAPPNDRPPRGADQEIVYFDGRPTLRSEQTKALLLGIVGLVLISLPILAATLFEWTWWTWWLTLICLIAAVLLFVVPWLILRATRYRITNYRIDFERGILKKKIDTLELWHVDDIKFEQGIIDRMFNVGSITVMSNDKTTPRLDLEGIPNPRSIFDSLKERVIAVKRQRGVIKMDIG
jgi:membrane protein YdbS with pleckstrin-like domain